MSTLKLTKYMFMASILPCCTNAVEATDLQCISKMAVAALPEDAYYLPESKAMLLNKVLDKHGSVRLDPNGDYSRAFTIKMKSNQALYGLASTRVPNIIIEPGSENVIVSGIHNKKLEFPPSKLVTSKNCFNSIRTSIEVKSARLENNLFTDFQGGIIKIDNTRNGYFRNNRFIKTMTHTAWPALTVRGNDVEYSFGNHFLWTNILGPLGDSVVIDGQKNIIFTGLDIESWGWGRQVRKDIKINYPAAINVSNTGFISLAMTHGGNHRVKNSSYFNLDANDILMLSSFVEKQTSSGLVLGENVKRLLAVNTRTIGHRAGSNETKVVELFKDDKPVLAQNWMPVSDNKISVDMKADVADILEQEKAIFRKWRKPVNEMSTDHSELILLDGLKVYKNASSQIQALVDRDNIAHLDAGLYYLSSPIKLKDGQGLIGKGQSKTILVADSSDIDLIVGATHLDKKLKSTWFVLADLTLKDGKNGVYHAASGSGGGAQYHRSILSHVTFSNMSNAAIMLDSIYGWDNNFLSHVNFMKCKTAIKQRPSPLYKGGDVPGTTYMDKNVCYRCNFVENGIALDMLGVRGNGLNAYINSKFVRNGKIIQATHPLSNFFANSVFIDNYGDPAIETNHMLGFFNSDFIQSIPGSIFQSRTLCDGCRFDIRTSKASVVKSDGNNKAELNLFINSELNISSYGDIYSGLLLNSKFRKTNLLENIFFDKNNGKPIFASQ